jgi:hypothetical protein
MALSDRRSPQSAHRPARGERSPPPESSNPRQSGCSGMARTHHSRLIHNGALLNPGQAIPSNFRHLGLAFHVL